MAQTHLISPPMPPTRLTPASVAPDSVAARLRAARRARKLSQVALSHQLHLPNTHVSDVERGARPVPLRRVAAWASLLGLDPVELLYQAVFEQPTSAYARGYADGRLHALVRHPAAPPAPVPHP